MDPDAGVYASISKTMAQRNDYLNLYFEGTDWLDKPHFPFWVTAFFFELFGYQVWVYKLPGILFVLLGAYYTYLFARKYYNKTIACWSAFILLTTMHIIISNNDVRAEPFLTGLIIASVYHFSNSLSEKWGGQLVAACFFAGCAVMTKGIFTLIPIGGAVIGELIITKNWKQLFHGKWILALVLVIVFMSPELYCLWKQFDLHPEKTVLGSQEVSGLQFFLWDSQFGRFFNTGPIKGKGDKLFFLHTLLWAFLPWSLIMYGAMFMKIRNGVRKIKTAFNEWFTLSGSVVTLLVFSFSGFQLPHYSNIVFPMLSILSAHFIWKQVQENKKLFGKIQLAQAVLVLVLGAVLLFLYKPVISVVFIAVLLAVLLFVIFLHSRFKTQEGFLPYLRSGVAVLLLAIVLNLCFYPDLMRYQSGNQVAAYMNRHYPDQELKRLSIYFPSGEFYMKQPVHGTTAETLALTGKGDKASRFLFVTEEELAGLKITFPSLEIVKVFDEFHVTTLSLKFIIPKTRHKEVKKQYLIRLLE